MATDDIEVSVPFEVDDSAAVHPARVIEHLWRAERSVSEVRVHANLSLLAPVRPRDAADDVDITIVIHVCQPCKVATVEVALQDRSRPRPRSSGRSGVQIDREFVVLTVSKALCGRDQEIQVAVAIDVANRLFRVVVG